MFKIVCVLLLHQKASCCQATTSRQSATFLETSCVLMGTVSQEGGSATDSPTASTRVMREAVVSPYSNILDFLSRSKLASLEILPNAVGPKGKEVNRNWNLCQLKWTSLFAPLPPPPAACITLPFLGRSLAQEQNIIFPKPRPSTTHRAGRESGMCIILIEKALLINLIPTFSRLWYSVLLLPLVPPPPP